MVWEFGFALVENGTDGPLEDVQIRESLPIIQEDLIKSAYGLSMDDLDYVILNRATENLLFEFIGRLGEEKFLLLNKRRVVLLKLANMKKAVKNPSLHTLITVFLNNCRQALRHNEQHAAIIIRLLDETQKRQFKSPEQ